MLTIIINILAIPSVEDSVLEYKQQQVMQNISNNDESKEAHKVSNTLNVSLIELGKPIAILEIPVLRLKLPVFQGSTDQVLANGIGLVDNSGSIEGGIGKNPLLSGHNGLSRNNLFTNLPDLEEGDKFFINIDGAYRSYEVYELNTILGEDLESRPESYLMPNPARSEMTLMTCVPRYDNSHRLLVRGKEIPFNEKDLEIEGAKTKKSSGLVLNIRFATILVIIVLVVRSAVKSFKFLYVILLKS